MDKEKSVLAIATSSLSKEYKHHKVVDQVSLHVPVGSIYGFVGENGAGKTTIMRLLCGLIRPSEGGYSLYGVLDSDPLIYEQRKNMAAIVEAPSLISSLSAAGNFTYFQKLSSSDKPIDVPAILKLVGLDEVGNKKVKDYSLGMRQRLAIGLCLVNSPRLLLLDEPMNGLDPEGIVSLRELILSLNKQGLTFFISSHLLSELEKVATHYGFIGHGRLYEEISASSLAAYSKPRVHLKSDDDIKAIAYLKEHGYPSASIYEGKFIQILGDFPLTPLIELLEKGGYKIISITKSSETVEEHYLQLAKGGH